MESSFWKTKSEAYKKKADEALNSSVLDGLNLSWGALVLILALAFAGWGIYSSIMFFFG